MDELNEQLGEVFNNGTSEDEITQETQETQEINQEVEPSQDEANQSYWAQHENAKKGFWKSEEDVIKGYDYYDKKFRPIETVLKQRGIDDHNGLTEVFSKYDEYSDPNSEINQHYTALQTLLNHPTYGNKFNDFVSQIVEQEEMQKYGMRLPQEVKQQLQEVEELKQWRQEQEHQKQVTVFEGELDGKINQLQDFCKSKGMEITDDDVKEHLLYCRDNNVGINHIFDSFVSKNIDKILGNIQTKTSQSITNNLAKNSKATVPTGSRLAGETTKIANSPDGLRSQLSKVLS